MNIEFYNNHIETLCDLKALADKHGCRLSFGVDHDEENGATSFDSFDCIFDNEHNRDIIDDLDRCGYIDDESRIKTTRFWFELYDPNNEERHYHLMSYVETTAYVKYYEWSCETPKDETAQFIEENEADWFPIGDDAHIFYYSKCDTIIKGFEKQEHPSVYRSGMALKFFGDLVCDYLGEQRIQRVY